MGIEWWYVLAGLLIALGFVGTVLPALPGVPLVFAGMLLAAWAGDFQYIGGWTLSLLGLLTLLAIGVDFVASALGTRVAGASRWAFVGAGVGALVGLFFGLIGLLLGPFLGAVAGELYATRSTGQATRAGLGASVGLLLGAVAKVALCFTMLGIFVLALLV